MYYALDIDSELNPMGGRQSNAAGRASTLVGTANTGTTTPAPVYATPQQILQKASTITTKTVTSNRPSTVSGPVNQVMDTGRIMAGGGGGGSAPAEEEKQTTGGGSDEIFGIDKKLFWGALAIIGGIWAYKKFKK